MPTRTIRFLLLAILVFSLSCNQKTKEKSKENQAIAQSVNSGTNGLYAVLISKNGTLVKEDYFNEKIKDDLCDVQSLTKGLMSLLVGVAIDKGYITNENESIAKYLPEEFASIEDERKKEITIKHILNQTSGLAWKGYLEHEAWLQSDNPLTFVLDKELEHSPGMQYNYNSGATHLLSAIISKATGKNTLAFANEVLFSELNIKKIDWQQRAKEFYDGSGLGLKMKPIDVLKIGQLLENEGQWNGEQLVSKEWIQKSFDPALKSETKWGLRGSTHGFCWYHAQLDGDIVNYGMGYGGQFILMIPSKKLVIVTTHNHDTPNGIEQQLQFLNIKLPKLIEEYGS